MFNYIQSSREEYFTINLGTQSHVINLLDCHLYAFIKTSPWDKIKTENQSKRSRLLCRAIWLPDLFWHFDSKIAELSGHFPNSSQLLGLFQPRLYFGSKMADFLETVMMRSRVWFWLKSWLICLENWKYGWNWKEFFLKFGFWYYV